MLPISYHNERCKTTKKESIEEKTEEKMCYSMYIQ